MQYIHFNIRQNELPAKEGGYIALISVLISGALMIMLGVGSSLRGIDTVNAVSGEESALRAELLADACAEEALLKLKANLGYSGDELIIVEGNDTCTINAVSGSGNTDRTIDTRAAVMGYVRNVQIDVAAVTPVLSIRSWRTVP